MLDCEFFGLNAGWHHLVNVALHIIAALLLFAALRSMTAVAGIADAGRDQRSRLQNRDTIWPSAFAAAVFAIHPLRVESVAWIAERKDVLSGVFFMLTLIAYARYVRAPSVARYLVLSIFLACGLMSKPMLVTTPFVLLLLDYWPLRRGRKEKSGTKNLVFGKIPLFALSAGSILATLWAQNFALGSAENLPLGWRINNAIVSYFDYIRQTFWPNDLIPFYVHPEGRLSVVYLVFAFIILALISVVVFVRRIRTHTWLLAGFGISLCLCR